MSEEQVPLNLMVKPAHKNFLEFIAKHMGVSVSAVGRWLIESDDGRVFLLTKACLKETDLPESMQRAA